MNQTVSFPFENLISAEEQDELLSEAVYLEKNEGEVITQQYGFGNDFYFLLEGEVNFSLQLEYEKNDFTFDTSSEQWTPIGWSGFRFPNRYATTVTCTKKSFLISWKHSFLKSIFKKHPQLGISFYNFTLEKSSNLIKDVRENLSQFVVKEWENSASEFETNPAKGSMEPDHSFKDLLNRAPFFENFEQEELNHIQSIAEERYYRRGEHLYEQGKVSDGFYILNIGKVLLQYTPINQNKSQSLVRKISNRGTVAGWIGGSTIKKNDTSAIAANYCSVYFLPKEQLQDLFNNSPQLGLKFANRLLWLLSNHLRNTRTRLISLQFEKEILAITNLIEQNCTQLSVTSPLHKVPHLLNSHLTVKDAFRCLEKVIDKGNTLEVSLANSCLDILGQTHREHLFFQGLKKVYNSVVKADKTLSPKQVRNISAESFISAFSEIPIQLKGLENLPKEGGNIFIYNHLLNHPYYTLPNHFQLTLDSHFISSMISYKHYGDAGIRVVRVPRAVEYGHQDYYNRLDYINVFTNESDTIEETPEQKSARRNLFYQQASDYLKQGTNLILSPEGTSKITEESPGNFKLGTFRIASLAEKEPTIVPIAFANFDKRVNRAKFTALVKQPFKLSEKLDNPLDKEQLFSFVSDYQKEFKEYVKEAIAFSKE